MYLMSSGERRFFGSSGSSCFFIRVLVEYMGGENVGFLVGWNGWAVQVL